MPEKKNSEIFITTISLVNTLPKGVHYLPTEPIEVDPTQLNGLKTN